MATIDNLKHFVAVVENNGVVRAAEKLFLSASSVTRSIQNIEDEIGHTLFDRIGRTMQVNHAGQDFYKKALSVLEQFKALLSHGSTNAKLSGHYKIGASHFLCENYVGKILRNISQKHKDATFEIYSFDTSVLIRKIHRGLVDLGFAFSPIDSEVLEVRTLHQGEMFLCGGEKHPLATVKFNDVRRKISQFPAIIHRPTDSVERCDNHPMFKKFGITPNIQMYWDSDYFAADLLKSNEHWTMLPDIVLEHRKSLKKFDHPENWKAPYEIGMIWNKNKATESLKTAFLENI